jgi:hypothetical protein
MPGLLHGREKVCTLDRVTKEGGAMGKRDARPIVVGVDASDSARAAADWAADLAAVWGAPPAG